MLTIRLSRIGRKGEAKYRVVVKEQRSKRDGAAIDTIGFFHKMVGKVEKSIDNDKLSMWISRGAKPSQAVKKIIEG